MWTLLTLSCVLDRTGQSASDGLQREIALARQRGEQTEMRASSLERQVDQLEEVLRYQSEQDAASLESFDQVVLEVRRLRGQVELLQHELDDGLGTGTSFRDDADFRLTWLELRAGALEENLGLEPADPPELEEEPGGSDTGSAAEDGGGVDEQADQGEEEVETGGTPDELMELARSHLRENRPRAARAILERLVEADAEAELVPEARYRLAESWFNEGGYQQAILRFEDVVSSHADSPWASWAMVRQGECFAKLGKSMEARLFWEDVIARYPKTKAAAEAKELLKQ